MSLRFLSCFTARRIALASAALLCAELAATSSGAATYYVAGGGSGTTCTATAPCAGLSQAMSNARSGDSIVCLSPPHSNVPDSNALLVDKSITIDCSTARALIQDQFVASPDTSKVGIYINIPPNSRLQTVRLRGLTIDGDSSHFGARYLDRGIEIVSAAAVYIEDCVISNATRQGIYDHRTGGQTKLFIKDSIVSGNGGTGIAVAPQGPTTTVLDNVYSENNLYGFGVSAGNSAVIIRSVFSGNTTAGVVADGGAQLVVNNSTISHNGIGVQSAQTVRLSNNDIAFNTTAVLGSSGTFGNNRFSGNGTIGTAPVALGGASSDLGQQ